MMKLALQMGMIPGESSLDKAKWARDHGAEGLELGVWGGGLTQIRRTTDEINGVLPISSVCGNADAEGNSSFLFLDPDLLQRASGIPIYPRTVAAPQSPWTGRLLDV